MSSHTNMGAVKDLKVRADQKFNQSALRNYLKETSCVFQKNSLMMVQKCIKIYNAN